jgi:hypothetical protein
MYWFHVIKKFINFLHIPLLRSHSRMEKQEQKDKLATTINFEMEGEVSHV